MQYGDVNVSAAVKTRALLQSKKAEAAAALVAASSLVPDNDSGFPPIVLSPLSSTGTVHLLRSQLICHDVDDNGTSASVAVLE